MIYKNQLASLCPQSESCIHPSSLWKEECNDKREGGHLGEDPGRIPFRGVVGLCQRVGTESAVELCPHAACNNVAENAASLLLPMLFQHLSPQRNSAFVRILRY
jgi:hypothetical protein